MIGRRKKPQNLWPLLVVPLVGAAGWAANRLLRRKKTTETASQNWPSSTYQGVNVDYPRNDPAVPPIEARDRENISAFAGNKVAVNSSIDQKVEAEASTAGHALRTKPEKWVPLFILLILFLVLPVAIVMLAFRHIPVQAEPAVTGGNAEQGRVLLGSWGCGSCHTIPGVTGATGKVGPALGHLSDQSYIAGRLQNTPENMIQWIMHPQQVSPGVDMPDSNVPESVARDMAAYLYSLH